MARTRWLSELAETLELAGKVALELDISRASDAPAAMLRGEIASLIAEVDSLRRAKPAAPIKPHPDWML